MSVENDGNSFAVQHLIKLERSITSKGSTYHKTVITALGEAGETYAVQHLIELEERTTPKGSTYHKTIIEALGRAGRIA